MCAERSLRTILALVIEMSLTGRGVADQAATPARWPMLPLLSVSEPPQRCEVVEDDDICVSNHLPEFRVRRVSQIQRSRMSIRQSHDPEGFTNLPTAR